MHSVIGQRVTERDIFRLFNKGGTANACFALWEWQVFYYFYPTAFNAKRSWLSAFYFQKKAGKVLPNAAAAAFRAAKPQGGGIFAKTAALSAARCRCRKSLSVPAYMPPEPDLTWGTYGFPNPFYKKPTFLFNRMLA